MSEPTLFDPGPPDPGSDAAPRGGGAGVNGPNSHPEHSWIRLPLVPPAHRNAPPTSRIAARRIAGRTATLRAAVLGLLVERGDDGATDEEIQLALGLASNTEIPRRWELVNLRLVVASGRRRPTRSGCPATVWVVATAATMPGTAGGKGVLR